jgi:Helix-turn-helix domain
VTAGRTVGRYRLPHIDGLPSQTRAALRVIVRLTPDANERAVLGALCEHMDGAGVCFLTYDRLTHHAGIGCKRTVQRTVARLRQKELVEVYRSRRDPSRYAAHLPRQSRQGDGPNWWRLGPTVRIAAGLLEVDMASVYGSAAAALRSSSRHPLRARPMGPRTQSVSRPESK